LDTQGITISRQAAQFDMESPEEVFVRQVEDRALPALQVLAEQQLGLAGEIPGRLFIP
jgi:hypothetical protein